MFGNKFNMAVIAKIHRLWIFKFLIEEGPEWGHGPFRPSPVQVSCKIPF